VKKGDTLRTRRRARSWENRFIHEIARMPSVKAACQAAKISRTEAYRRRSEDAAFRARWNDALAEGVDALEAAAVRRALRSSDSLLMFLLRAHRPEVFDRDHAIVREQGPPAGIVPVKVETKWLRTEIPFSREQLDWLATIQTANGNGSDRI
jgi:hypothetical protein